MFSRLRKAMQARAAVRQTQEEAEQAVAKALVRQVQAAATVRQLDHLLRLATRLLPGGRHLALVVAVASLKLVALPVQPIPASPRSSSSRTRRGKSTTRRRR